ncbi:MAG: DNA alkylation repair protein [Bacteroidota bacterium]
MAEPLKNRYNRTFFDSLLQDFEATGYSLDPKSFYDRLFSPQWEAMELKERLRHITEILHEILDKPFADALEILKPVAARQAPSFEHMFFPDYVELYGLEEDWDTAMAGLEHFTQYSSSEFAIRPFILRDAKRAMSQMVKWATHENHHVRRLASEGCRPRLPWAMALPDFKRDPAPILPILGTLKNDPSEYVRRSVANNLNDIAKDHPEIVLKIAKEWLGHTAETDWIVKHACRTLLKQGNPQALRLFGFGDPALVRVSDLRTTLSQVAIGEDLHFGFALQHQASSSLKLRVEYGIYYLKANGKQNRKVFMITENEYEPQKVYPFERKQSFRNMTTRKHYPGAHRLSIIVNGEEQLEVPFEVVS